jgi:hypothetical protein
MTLTIQTVTPKERLHQLVDELSDDEAAATLRLIDRRHADPLLRAIADAPEDDEPFTDDDEAAIVEVEADKAAGIPAIAFEEVQRKYGQA